MANWGDNYNLNTARTEIDNVSTRLKEFSQDMHEDLFKLEYRVWQAKAHYDWNEREFRQLFMPRVDFMFAKISEIERAINKLQKKYVAPSRSSIDSMEQHRHECFWCY